jgi:hypothetical protein
MGSVFQGGKNGFVFQNGFVFSEWGSRFRMASLFQDGFGFSVPLPPEGVNG